MAECIFRLGCQSYALEDLLNCRLTSDDSSSAKTSCLIEFFTDLLELNNFQSFSPSAGCGPAL